MPHSTSPLQITTRACGPTLVVEAAGELDLATHQQLRDHLHHALDAHPGTREVIADLSRLTFTDCAGLGALVWARNHTHRAGAAFTIHAANPHITRILRFADLAPQPAAHRADPGRLHPARRQTPARPGDLRGAA